MSNWNNDKELFALARKTLFPALLGDILDQMGYLHQYLPPQIRVLASDMVIIGRAMPVLEADVYSVPGESYRGHAAEINQPFGLMFAALDSLREDEVYICSGSSWEYALWGGLMSTRAQKLQAAGAVVNGYSRDTAEILRLGFPVASGGSYGQDQGPRGKVIDYRVPIRFGNVDINPGDIVFGDRDGVVIVPQQVEQAAFVAAIEKSEGENAVLRALQGGMSCVDVFDKFGIM